MLILLGIALAFVGIALGGWGLQSFRGQSARYTDARARWIKTSATVIDSRILEREQSHSDGHGYTYYEPRLRYRYNVGGVDHEGDRLTLGAPPTFSLADRAEDWLCAHAPGMVIDLCYDPAQPQDSSCTLDKPSLFGAVIRIAVGAGLAAMGGMVLGFGA
jgi:hypothetical protein